MSDKPKESEAVTINLQPFIQPATMLLSAIIIAGSILISGGRVLGTATTTATTPTTTATTPAATGTTTVSLDTIKSLYSGDYIKFGDANRKLLFVEVADPSCPYCHIAGGVDPDVNKSAGAQFTLTADGGSYVAPVTEMRKLVDSGQASYLYIFYPGHGNGEMGMRALYCAFEAGKFWEVHDLIMSYGGYKIQNGYDASQATVPAAQVVGNDKSKSALMADFLKSAEDPTTMKNCLDSGKYDSRLTSEPAEATALGVNGTPGFFVNATTFAGAYSWTDMQSAVTAALQ